MSEDLRWIVPQPPPQQQDVLEAHQATREFYQEVHHRDRFERYCQWYYAAVRQHQQEYQRLQRDVNFFGWFCRRG